MKELTKEQIESFPSYVKKWVDVAVHQPTRDIDTVTSNIRWLYEQCGYDSTNVQVSIVDSLDEWIEISRSQVWSKVWSQVRSQVESQVMSQVWSQIESQVMSQVRSQVESQVRSQVWSKVWSQVRSQVRSQVESQVMSQVWSQVRSQVESQVRSQVRSQVWSQVMSQVESQVWYNADDIAYGDFFYNNGFITENKDTFYKYADVIQDAGMAIYLENRCYLLAKPAVRLNESGLPHSDNFPAIQWKDGSGIYQLNGVVFEKGLWEKVVSGKMPFKDILAIEDIDQRTQAMRYGNVWDFLEHSNAVRLDEYQKLNVGGEVVNYYLYEIPPSEELFTDYAYYMVYDCPSTGKLYMSGVPKTKTVPQAMAWKFSSTQKDWKLLVPSVTES